MLYDFNFVLSIGIRDYSNIIGGLQSTEVASHPAALGSNLSVLSQCPEEQKCCSEKVNGT